MTRREFILLHVTVIFVVLCSCMCVNGARRRYPAGNSVMDDGYHIRRMITVSTILLEPYTMARSYNSSSHSGAKHYEGYMVDLMDRLAHVVGFNYRMIPVWDSQFGFPARDGRWSGMIGDLIRRDADIAAGPMFITRHRSKVVDFTAPFMDVSASLLMRQPPVEPHPPIYTVEDLINHPRMTYGTLNKGMIPVAIRKAALNDTFYAALWDEIESFGPSSLTVTNEEGIAKVRSEDYVFILPSTIADYITRRRPCDLLAVDNFLLRAGYGLAVPKGSALLTYLNRGLRLLKESGELDYLYAKWWVKKGQCSVGVRTSRMLSYSSGETHQPTWCSPSAVTMAWGAAFVLLHQTLAKML